MLMEAIKTVVVEDEQLPRLALLQKLKALWPRVEITDSCDNYETALETIKRTKPQLVFLDIQLHGRNSIDMLKELRQSSPSPYVIFTTAYDKQEYLLNAIRMQAVDYLLKPIDKKELSAAIDKVEKLCRHDQLIEETRHGGKCLFRTASGHLFVSTDDIFFIRSNGNYSVVVTSAEEVMVMESLIGIERRLQDCNFVRADRQHIINKRMVYKINSKKAQCLLQAPDGTKMEVQLSKNGMEQLILSIS